MRRGGGSRKGAGFERKVCKKLSKWVSHGKYEDLFWRSSMSGGRSTVARKKGKLVRQSGDVCSVDPGGHVFTETWYVECKFYRKVDLEIWIIKGGGKIGRWWKLCRKNAKHYKKKPMLIVKQNGWPWLVITRHGAIEQWTSCQARIDCRGVDISLFEDMLLTKYYPDQN